MKTNEFLLPSKADIQRSFNRAAQTYDEAAFLQREICNRLFERLDYIKLNPVGALDLGSGTGYSTRKLRERYPQSNLLAIDIAPAMLKQAHDKTAKPAFFKRLFAQAPRCDYVCADAEHLPLANESAELILSNLTLQWCNPENVFREAMRILKPGGLLMFTTFGPDTLKELRSAFAAIDETPHVNLFLDMHDVGDQLVHAGFADPVMDVEMITLTYTALLPLLRELKNIGAHNVMPGRRTGLLSRSAFQRVVDGYERFRTESRLPATYEVVYGHAWKPLVKSRKTIDGEQVIGLADFKKMVQK